MNRFLAGISLIDTSRCQYGIINTAYNIETGVNALLRPMPLEPFADPVDRDDGSCEGPTSDIHGKFKDGSPSHEQ